MTVLQGGLVWCRENTLSGMVYWAGKAIAFYFISSRICTCIVLFSNDGKWFILTKLFFCSWWPLKALYRTVLPFIHIFTQHISVQHFWTSYITHTLQAQCQGQFGTQSICWLSICPKTLGGLQYNHQSSSQWTSCSACWTTSGYELQYRIKIQSSQFPDFISNVFIVHLISQFNHVEHSTTGCQGEVYILDFNMAGRSEEESVSNSSGESR